MVILKGCGIFVNIHSLIWMQGFFDPKADPGGHGCFKARGNRSWAYLKAETFMRGGGSRLMMYAEARAVSGMNVFFWGFGNTLVKQSGNKWHQEADIYGGGEEAESQRNNRQSGGGGGNCYWLVWGRSPDTDWHKKKLSTQKERFGRGEFLAPVRRQMHPKSPLVVIQWTLMAECYTFPLEARWKCHIERCWGPLGSREIFPLSNM